MAEASIGKAKARCNLGKTGTAYAKYFCKVAVPSNGRVFGTAEMRNLNHLGRLNLRTALVIEEIEAFRNSLVQLLRSRGWIAHGIGRAEQALPLLQHIPYAMIIVRLGVAELAVAEFARILHESDGVQKIYLVAIIESKRQSNSSIELLQFGAFVARRAAWREDLTKLLKNFERLDNNEFTSASTGAIKQPVAQRGVEARAYSANWISRYSTF